MERAHVSDHRRLADGAVVAVVAAVSGGEARRVARDVPLKVVPVGGAVGAVAAPQHGLRAADTAAAPQRPETSCSTQRAAGHLCQAPFSEELR